ncbi:MAG TPA: hypothetical protein VHE37_15360 [Nevskiaceae bacterium]|nr:hypothetical protein [Nevskiaceae bacterium]
MNPSSATSPLNYHRQVPPGGDYNPVSVTPNPYPILADLSVREQAYAAAEKFAADGVKCYVRSWHLGDVGYFVCSTDTYDRLWPDHRAYKPTHA